MTTDVVDFRRPGRVAEDISHLLTSWQQRMREALELLWGRCIPNGVRVTPGVPTLITGAELRQLADNTVCYRIDLQQTGQVTLLVVSRSLALTLINEVVGDPGPGLAEDRPLTQIEMTCLDYLVEDLRRALEASQQLSPKRTLANLGVVALKELHSQFPEQMTNTEVNFEIALPYGADRIRWILPQDVTLDFAASSITHQATNDRSRAELQRLVLNTPGQLRVRLGNTEASLAKLSQLKPGDVIVLDQRIDEPLTAELGGQELFVGWGARVGRQQAFQIDATIDS